MLTKSQTDAIEDAIWDYLQSVKDNISKPSIYMQSLMTAFPDITKKAKKRLK